MKTTCIGNSTLRILLEPETAFERAILEDMASRSEKGTTTVLAAPERDGKEFVIEVGKP